MKTRDECLAELRHRLEINEIFFPDVWEKLQQTETAVLREIVESEFEREVFAKVRPVSHV
jgi:shikimate kinase